MDSSGTPVPPHPRCELLSDIEGDVLELGPGPGPNLACLVDNNRIRSYTGIEPNEHMHHMFEKKAQDLGLTFPIRLLTLKVSRTHTYRHQDPIKTHSFNVLSYV
jgi:hypothetical protein